MDSYEFYNVVYEDIDYLDSDVQAVVGFGASMPGMPNFIESLVTAGVIDSQKVTFDLNIPDDSSDPVDSNDDPVKSTITLGTPPDSALTTT